MGSEMCIRDRPVAGGAGGFVSVLASGLSAGVATVLSPGRRSVGHSTRNSSLAPSARGSPLHTARVLDALGRAASGAAQPPLRSVAAGGDGAPFWMRAPSASRPLCAGGDAAWPSAPPGGRAVRSEEAAGRADDGGDAHTGAMTLRLPGSAACAVQAGRRSSSPTPPASGLPARKAPARSPSGGSCASSGARGDDAAGCGVGYGTSSPPSILRLSRFVSSGGSSDDGGGEGALVRSPSGRPTLDITRSGVALVQI